MAEDAGVKIISRLGINYKPAIDATRELMNVTAQLDAQLRRVRMTAQAQGKQLGASMSGYARTAGHEVQRTDVIYDRHGRILKDLNQTTQQATQTTKTHSKAVAQTGKAYSVLGSQWERRISWFVAGVGFYGFIRQARAAVDTIRQIESDMIVIARTTNDVTFNLSKMRDELQNIGMEYGHTWDVVQDIALRWTQAGYDMADTLELTRVGLLALNVAEMDVKMASEGLIAIMAQWGFEADELEGVIDKLNITSDNFAVTTGDLIDGLVRASGAARAVGATFEDTVGIITATRVATGRTGREVGNAVNTIMAFMVRQQTINKLMEAGIDVFADKAQTKLRPAIEMIGDIAEQWGDRAEEMPDELLEIAEQMGVMTEEMAEMVGMQEEWNDLQKIDIESSAAGIRRRSFFIALLRNFAQVQEVVVNMHDAENYSMMQNIMTMDTLEKQMQQLSVAVEQLAVAVGESGLMGQLESIVETSTSVVEAFANMDSFTRSLIYNFAVFTLGAKVVSTVIGMMGLKAGAATIGVQSLKYQIKSAIGHLAAFKASGAGASASMASLNVQLAAAAPTARAASASLGLAATSMKGFSASVAATSTAMKYAFMPTLVGLKKSLAGLVAFMGGPYVAASIGIAAVLYAQISANRKLTEEMEEQSQMADLMIQEHERLSDQMERNLEDSTQYEVALESLRGLNQNILEQFPELVEGYDKQQNLILINTERLEEKGEAYRELSKQKEDYSTQIQRELSLMQEEVEMHEQGIERLERDRFQLGQLIKKRQVLLEAMEEEGIAQEKLEDYKRQEEDTRRVIINLLDNEAVARVEAANWSIEALNKEMEAIELLGQVNQEKYEAALFQQQSETENLIANTKSRIQAMTEEMEMAIKLQAIQSAFYAEHGVRRAIPPGATAGGRYVQGRWVGHDVREMLSLDVDKHAKEIRELQEKDLADSERRLQEIQDSLAESIAKVDSLDAPGDPSGEAARSTRDLAGATRSLSDEISNFIEQAKKAAELQELINTHRKREMDLISARVSYYDRDRATTEQRLMGLQEEARLIPLMRSQQRGLSAEADALRSAKERLISRQRSVNTSTEEGRKAYESLNSEIESIRGSILNLSTAWWDLQAAQEVGITGTEMHRSLRESNIELIESEIDYLTRIGATQEELNRAEDLSLTLLRQRQQLTQQYNNQIREQRNLQHDALIALNNDRITRSQYNELVAETSAELGRLKILLRENTMEMESLTSGARRLQGVVDNSIESLSYYASLGIMTTKELVKYTRQAYSMLGQLTVDQEREVISELARLYRDKFGEMRDAAEEAYRDRLDAMQETVDAEIAEYQRLLDMLDDEQQEQDREEAKRKHLKTMQDLTEQRWYHELRTGIEHERSIEDIDKRMAEEQIRWKMQLSDWEREDQRDLLRDKMEEVRDRAEEQRQEWQEAYERMQSDFNDHNIALLAYASAYDKGFFEDAKRKAQKWIDGFREGMPSDFLGGYFEEMVKVAAGEAPSYQEPSLYDPATADDPLSQPKLKDTYVIEHEWGHVYKITSGGHVIYKDGVYVEPENFRYLPPDILDLARAMKVQQAHTGAMTMTGGLAELLPGELVFPPNLSMQLERLITTLTSTGGQQLGTAQNYYNIDTLLNAENIAFEDYADIEILARELYRQIHSIA